MAGEILEIDLPRIAALLQSVLGISRYESIRRMGGLSNRTYHVVMEDGGEYVVRIPGDGTEELICRSDEKLSTTLACDLGVDAELLYFGEDGSKITRYIPDAVTMSADSLRDETRIGQMADIFRRMHSSGADTGVPFDVFPMAESYEAVIHSKNVDMFPDYNAVKAQVMAIKTGMDAALDIPKVPCHNDPLCENWVAGGGRMYLIDWEYAGMNDGMWDVADVSIEAGFDSVCDTLLLRRYLDREPTAADRKHFTANKIYVDYLWTLWAKARVPYDGQFMEDWAAERYARLKENISVFEAIRED